MSLGSFYKQKLRDNPWKFELKDYRTPKKNCGIILFSSSEKSTFFHQIGWKIVVENSYGLSPYYLVAKHGHEITGILPLFNVDNRLVSVPFAPYGGPLAQDETTSTMLLKADCINHQK